LYQHNNNLDTDRYTKNTFIKPVETTKTREISNVITDIDGTYIQIRSKIPTIPVSGNISSKSNVPSQHNYQNKLIRGKNIPSHSSSTNTNCQGIVDITTRNYNRLHKKLSYGSFKTGQNIPTTGKDITIKLRTTPKQELMEKMKTLR
jgi:hypothetical protein